MPVRLVDLRAAQSQWARGYRRSRWLEHGTSVLLVGTFALNFAIASSAAGQGVGETHYRLSLIFLGVALVVLVVTTWVAPALWRLRDRRGPGLASPGTTSTGEVRSNAPGPEIWAATRAALERAGYQPPWLLDRHTMESRRSRLGRELLRDRARRGKRGWRCPCQCLGAARDLHVGEADAGLRVASTRRQRGAPVRARQE